MGYKVLLVEDEAPIQQTVRDTLELAGHDLVTCDNGNDAVEVFHKEKPDIVVLDWMLPGKDGIQILKELISNPKDPAYPIIMASANREIEQVEEAFDHGVSDYVKKPYGGRELINTIERVLKHFERPGSGLIKLGPIEIDVSAYEVRRNGSKILLTPLEFNLLLTIAEDPKHTFTREELLKKVWLHKNLSEQNDFKGKIDTRLVNVHIQRLRSKIEENPDDPQIVTTVRGRGYKAGLE